MKRFNQVLLFFILSIFNTFLFAQHKVIQIQNDVTRLDFKTEGRYTQIDYSGAYPVIKQPNPGHPELPIISYRLIVREGASVSSVEIIGITETELPGNYYLYPAQQQFAIGEERVFTPPDLQIYQQNEKYPATLVRHAHTGNFGGHRIASFLVYPLRYNPVTQKLYFYEEITFRIRYSTGAVETIRPERLFKQDQARFEGVVRRMVANPEEVTQYRPVIEQTRVSGNLEFSQVPSAEGLGVRYLVITSDALAPAFEPLVEFKNTTGTTAEIRSLEWIKANTHPGVDDAETIRNFIKWAYQKWGTQYVLLGGDTGIIPTRMVYSNTMTVSTDMYFSDLDGSWNYDGDSRFGEVEDSLDYYPEMFVSRAPVHSAAEASNFVNKTLTYLKAENFPSGYTTGMLTIGADLWSQGDGGEFCEFVTDSVPAYINKTTL
ncbi:MAG: hypothetical protein GWN30_25610, partial [Gammaproteobacteria bacterium]|nr:hypothetical protein [Gammaproteobacteria bacterium]NIX02626.1 hypothetical protein [Phycisphaerae bacterium]